MARNEQRETIKTKLKNLVSCVLRSSSTREQINKGQFRRFLVYIQYLCSDLFELTQVMKLTPPTGHHQKTKKE